MQERHDNPTNNYVGHCGEEIFCDSCGKPMDILDYYNQDGVCVQCFKKWCGYDI